MTESLITVAIWIPAVLALAGYIAARRRLPPSRGLLAFDMVVVSVDVLVCAGFFWREITGHISESVWADERLWFPWIVPLWVDLISVPLLVLGATVRYFLFSPARQEATRAA
jgi:hypothetical protein